MHDIVSNVADRYRSLQERELALQTDRLRTIDGDFQKKVRGLRCEEEELKSRYGCGDTHAHERPHNASQSHVFSTHTQ